MAMFIVKPWYRKKDDAIYGAEWAGTSDPSWVRTDAAVGFADPNPYYSGMSTTPSSPFDNIMPWSGMRRVTDASAGELVEIPKFYYKWTRDGVKMKLQISMSQFDGSHVSPAHADRGDGVGERDYVYVGRYSCASDYTSKSGVTPRTSINLSTFRSNIHNIRNNVWQQDFALFWTIRMLYLVEYAHWNSQIKIGYGGGTGTKMNTGYTDSMPYHTGTTQTSRTTFGVGIQYRYIEGIHDNVTNWLDGIYITSNQVYCINNPSYFADSSNGTYVGNRATDMNVFITGFTNPSSILGYEYALFPNAGGGTATTYCCNRNDNDSGTRAIFVGSNYGNYGDSWRGLGMFSLNAYFYASFTYDSIGSRLMVLPPSRLST